MSTGFTVEEDKKVVALCERLSKLFTEEKIEPKIAFAAFHTLEAALAIRALGAMAGIPHEKMVKMINKASTDAAKAPQVKKDVASQLQDLMRGL